MLKQNKGITLVALVITIIVLLILAGVSISLVVGDNGVLTQSQNAAKKTDVASANTAMQLALTSVNTAFLGDVWTNNVNAKITSVDFSDLQSAIVGNGYVVSATTGITDSKITDGMTITIKQSASTTTSYTYTIELNDSETQMSTTLLSKADD